MDAYGPWRRALVQMTWGAAGIFLAAGLYAMIHFLSVTPLGPPPTFRGVLAWQLAAWAIWIPAIPLLSGVAERLSMRVARREVVVLQHVVVALVATAMHALWYAWVTTHLSPYLLFREFDAAFFFYLRWSWPIALMIYAALALDATRATRSLLSFSASPDGLLRTIGRSAGASGPAFDSLLEAMREPVLVFDPDSLAVLAVNEAATAQYGWSPQEFGRLTLLDIHQPQDGQAAEQFMQQRRHLPIWRAHEWHRRKDGSSFEVELTNHAVIFDGRWARMMLVTDVTALAQAQEAREALVHSERRAAELQLQLAEAQLRALKLQLKPHFLFNILNTVAMMIRNGKTAKAQQVVSLLGDLFRRLLEFEGENTISLEQELSFADLYLALEQFRFEDRMVVHRDFEPAALTSEVPILILQPLVENAVKHGVAGLAGTCEISLSARRDGDRLRVEIVNDVRAGGPRPTSGHGIGVRNTRARLAEMYGDDATLELFPDERSMRAVITIPQRGTEA